MDKQMDGLAEGRRTEGFAGWMDGRTDLYVIRYDDNQLF